MHTPFLLAVVLALVPSAAPDETESEALLRRVLAFDESLDPVNRLSGVLLVVRGEDVLLQRTFGMADYELGVPNAFDTRFCIASITKVMTHLVAWQLLVEEKLALQSPLSDFVPDFPRGDEITVEHLMRHRAGLPHRVTEPSDTWKPMTAEEVTERAMEFELLFEPGSRSVYSSATYSVLARVIEIVEGAPFSEVLARRIFEPAGMTRTLDPDSMMLVPGRARSYMPGRDGLLNAPLQDMSFLVGAGSVVSTAEDLLLFLRAYRGGTFGEQAWASTRGGGRQNWTGASNGFHAFVDFDPETDTVVVYTGNTFGGGAGQLHEALPKLLAGEDILGRARPSETVNVDPGKLAEYVGRYESRPGSFWTVALRDDELVIADSVALPLSDTEFYFQGWSRVFTFVREAEGGPWAIRSEDWAGNAQVWPRVR